MKKYLRIAVLLNFTCFIVLGSLNPVFAQDKGKLKIGVLGLDAKGGVTPNEASTLADRLRTELVNIGVYDVLERGQMTTILQEQGFNLSGCVSSECAIEAGRLLGARLMVAGDVGKIGNTITMDVRMFDVTTGKIVRAPQHDFTGEISGLLGLIKIIAKQLAGQEPDTQKQEVKRDDEGGFPWMWVGLGTLLVGGGVAALVLSGDDGGSDDTTPLPNPVWPPN